jgi:hypothetical protein
MPFLQNSIFKLSQKYPAGYPVSGRISGIRNFRLVGYPAGRISGKTGILEVSFEQDHHSKMETEATNPIMQPKKVAYS